MPRLSAVGISGIHAGEDVKTRGMYKMIKLIPSFDYEMQNGVFLRWLRYDPKTRWQQDYFGVKASIPLLYRWIRFFDWLKWRFPAAMNVVNTLYVCVGVLALVVIITMAVWAGMQK